MRFLAAALSVVFAIQAAPASAISHRDLKRLLFRPNRASAAAVEATAARRRVVPPPVQSACPAAVLSPFVYVLGLVEDGSFLYVSDLFGGIVRVSKNGESPRLLAEFDTITPNQMAADATTLYFLAVDNTTLIGEVYSLPKAGGMAVRLASEIEFPFAIAVDDAYVYWIDVGTFTGSGIKPDGKVERVKKNGESRQTLASSLSAPFAVALDETDVYFSETGLALGNRSAGLRKVRKSGGAVTKLTDGRPVVAIDIEGTEAFYSSAADGDAFDPQISRIATSGGPSTTVYRDLFVLNLVVDGGTILIMGPESDESDYLASIPKSGGQTRILRRGVLDSYTLAFDACAVYYGLDAALERFPR
jgi:hypothetical protein